jgi:hypothetical protein
MNISFPKTIYCWCMWLFFLFVGLGMFLPVLAGITPWLALAYAILSVLGL